MVLSGRVEGGAIVLEDETVLPEGARVRIEVLGPEAEATEDPAQPGTLYERLKRVAGVAKGLPADFAAQHDHDIHGQPKR